MNDNTNEQPQGTDTSSTSANVAEAVVASSPKHNKNASLERSSQRRGERSGKSSLADASGADALMELARQMRLARGELEQEVSDVTADAHSGDAAVQRSNRNTRQVKQEPRSGHANRSQRSVSSGERRASTRKASSSGRGIKGQKSEVASAAMSQQPPARVLRPLHPVLLKLKELYPRVFGDQPLPLKRGVYQDLVAANPTDFDAAELKVALGLHTRSYRYLSAVSQGVARHDLQGVEVEPMAPEHVHHALLEVFRRRKPRDGEDMAVKLRRRIAIAFEASGLTREAYDALVRGKNVEANAALDDALADVAERDAKAQALCQAFEASGKDELNFAEMYGVRPQAVQQAVKRCKQIAQRQIREAKLEVSSK